MKNIIGTSGVLSSSGNTSTSSTGSSMWGMPEFVHVIDTGESIEMIYKETSMLTTLGIYSRPEERVFKIVYSCVDGKWNKSERIYGKVVPPSDEWYDFDDE